MGHGPWYSCFHGLFCLFHMAWTNIPVPTSDGITFLSINPFRWWYGFQEMRKKSLLGRNFILMEWIIKEMWSFYGIFSFPWGQSVITKTKLVTDNFLGTLASSSRANPKICQIPAVQTLKSVLLSLVTKTQPKCALGLRPTILAHFASQHFVHFATCPLPKCASRAQNPTFVPYLHTLFYALESYSSFLWSFLSTVIARLRPPNLRFAKHLLRVGWRNFFSSCAVVSVFGSGGK